MNEVKFQIISLFVKNYSSVDESSGEDWNAMIRWDTMDHVGNVPGVDSVGIHCCFVTSGKSLYVRLKLLVIKVFVSSDEFRGKEKNNSLRARAS